MLKANLQPNGKVAISFNKQVVWITLDEARELLTDLEVIIRYGSN